MSDPRLWGWLSPDQPDPLAASPMAEDHIARMFGLARLTHTPPKALEPGSVPASRLTAPMLRALVRIFGDDGTTLDPVVRASAMTGQSYADQLVRRSGRARRGADAVVAPKNAMQVQGLIDAGAKSGFRVMAAGGATNVVGAFDARDDGRPIVVASLRRLNRVIEIEETNRTVTAEAGIQLSELEAKLNAQGLTLGHFPQSYRGATLGGSIACNGAGQRSDLYGRIGDNLVSARLATPSGPLATEAFRHAAAGPWTGGLIAGSEGLLGIVTEATLRLRAAPETIADAAWYLPNFMAAIDAARRIGQADIGVAMLRISDVAETRFLHGFRQALAGRNRVSLFERLALAVKRAPSNPCLVIVGAEGRADEVRGAQAQAARVLRHAGGVALGERPGESWRRSRYDAPYLRESLMSRGLGVDTYETAAPWSELERLHAAVPKAIIDAAGGAKAIVFCHLSHSYIEGACLYYTAIFTRDTDAMKQWKTLKKAATGAIVRNGGSISHHHGLGADHAPWAIMEKSKAGLNMPRALAKEIDPHRVMATGIEMALYPDKIRNRK